MTDIVERLKRKDYVLCPINPDGYEAANEIVRLRAEVARIKLEAKEVDGLWHLDILRANAAEAECARMRAALTGVIIGWEALAGGRDYSPREVEQWLIEHMKPAINGARAALGKTP
jgi:hypothetical protein